MDAGRLGDPDAEEEAAALSNLADIVHALAPDPSVRERQLERQRMRAQIRRRDMEIERLEAVIALLYQALAIADAARALR